MAPKKGGGGGGYYSGSSSSSCNDGLGFQDSIPRAIVAFEGIFIILGIGLFVFYVSKKEARPATPFYLYGISLLFWILHEIFNLLSDVLNECAVINLFTLTDLIITTNFIYAAAICLLYATAFFPICSYMYRTFGSKLSGTIKLMHTIGLAAVVAVYIANLAVSTSVDLRYLYYTSFLSYKHAISDFKRANDILLTSLMLQLIVVLAISIGMIVAWAQGRKRTGESYTAVPVWIVVFATALCVLHAVQFGHDVYFAPEIEPSDHKTLLEYHWVLPLVIVSGFLDLIAYVAILALAQTVVPLARRHSAGTVNFTQQQQQEYVGAEVYLAK